MMQQITREDLLLINSLSSRKYSGISLSSNSTEYESTHLKEIKHKLRTIAEYFSLKYRESYGPFETGVSSGNPLTRGNTFNHVWSVLFKGAPNKQYAAQISFVFHKDEACLDVGFFFGRASGHNLGNEQKIELESTLANLGISLSDAIQNNNEIQSRYNSLFDFGFIAYSNGRPVLPNEWCNLIRISPSSSQIIAKVYPNDFDVIENSTIDSFVSQVIFLMAAIREVDVLPTTSIIKPLTPEQRAKQVERLAQIGLKGELFIMALEQKRLKEIGIIQSSYPKHVALESMHYGYDILSLDENGNEIYIEVKTTTRTQEDVYSRKFFISNNECDVFQRNKDKYKLYRVYNIESRPSYEELSLETVTKYPDGFIVEY